MFTRCIYPLALRERLFGRMNKYLKNKPLEYKNVSLQFNKKLRLDLTPADYCHRNMIINGFWELIQTEEMLKIAKQQGGLLVDVGANYGYYTCLWADAKHENRVVAFEASPLNVGPLRNNIEKNGLNNKIKVEPFAAGKEKGKLKFDLRNDEQETGHGGFSLEENKPSLVEVDVLTLDEYATQNGIEKIEVLKIDTEGADTWVLYGAKELLKAHKINHIFFESNNSVNNLNILPNEAKDFLENFGYKVVPMGIGDSYATIV